MQILPDNKVFIWGCGKQFDRCEKFLRLQRIKIDYVIDSNRFNTRVGDYYIYPVSVLGRKNGQNNRILVTSAAYFDEISEQLEELGYDRELDFTELNLYIDQYISGKQIISLGYNCEISQRLNEFSLVDSYPFSWAYVLNREKLLKAIEEPEIILSKGEVLGEDGMFLDLATDLRLHSHIHRDQLFDLDRDPVEEKVEEALDELHGRTRYLVTKFNKLSSFRGTLIFIGKYQSDDLDEDIGFYSRMIEILKHKFHDSKVELFIVRERGNRIQESLVPKDVRIRYVARYADDKHTDTDGDFEGWYRIIREIVFSQ